jgi:hypothetical protein
MPVYMSAKRHRQEREVVEGLTLPVPGKGTIAHTIISKMEGWKKIAEILTQVPPDVTQNLGSVRVVICQLIDAGYLTREHAPYSRRWRGGQSYALTDAGREVRDYINLPT